MVVLVQCQASDLLVQGEKFFNSTYFPVVFICLDGHVLEICTAVSLEYIVVNSILRLEKQR